MNDFSGLVRMGPQRAAVVFHRRQRHRQVAPADRAGHRGRHGRLPVKYVLAAKLVNELVEAADERLQTKTIARYGRGDLLCIDELGHMELDRRGAELLFQVLTEREEKNSMAIASNESFSAWTKTFTDPRLCAAIVDRLTFGGNIIETGTDSYRLAHTKARAEQAQSLAGGRTRAYRATIRCAGCAGRAVSARSSRS
nr:ATP-binding protein [Streptomyces mirabilis]